jgi:diguanylate cyclase (GGDEF)-like protein
MDDLSIIMLILAIIGMVVVGVVTYRRGKLAGYIEQEQTDNKKQRQAFQKDILSRDEQIQNLRDEIHNINNLNRRYLTFMMNVSAIIHRLNTAKSDEVISTLLNLVRDLILTDTVDLYRLDIVDNRLKKVGALGQNDEKQVSYSSEEGIVGMAARDGIVKIRGRDDKGNVSQKDTDSQLWMAAPINIGGRLFGVLAIGQVKNPTGNENNLMKIIADIGGMVLVNRSIIGEAKREANTDPLTGLSNRRHFFEMTQIFVEKSIMEGNTPISIVLFDIDDFKNYNDRNGHEAGDELLKKLGSLMLSVTRKGSVAARYGGEEFIVMLPGIAKVDAIIYAERLRENIAVHPFPHREKQPRGCVSISGGIACFPFDARSIKDVIKLADEALYRAKAEGKNRVIAHESFLFSDPDIGKETGSSF